jgi:hypothetical protein
MSIVTIPSGMLFKRQDFGTRDFGLDFSNADSGASQTAINGPPRLTCSLVANDAMDRGEAAAWRALVLSLKGRVNQLAVHDVLNAAPRGTMRGSLTLASAASAGADSLRISGGVSQAGKTLLLGDWIGVNQAGTNRQLLHVQSDAVADSSGVIVVSVAPNLRVAVGVGSQVSWDKPTCLMRRTTQENSWSSNGATQGSFNLDLMEDWS